MFYKHMIPLVSQDYRQLPNWNEFPQGCQWTQTPVALIFLRSRRATANIKTHLRLYSSIKVTLNTRNRPSLSTKRSVSFNLRLQQITLVSFPQPVYLYSLDFMRLLKPMFAALLYRARSRVSQAPALLGWIKRWSHPNLKARADWGRLISKQRCSSDCYRDIYIKE